MHKLAIPTYKRVDIFKQKTLNYLKQTNFDLDNVYLFVANEQEKKDYQTTGLKNIIVGVETIKHQRNFIRKYFNEGEEVFSLDDDIIGLWKATTPKTFELITDLTGFIEKGFELCKKVNTKLWGISAVKNALFLYGNKPTTNLKYVVGAAFGQIIDHDDFLSQTIDDKGDYERSIKYFIKFGSILRFNNIAPETKYYKSKGGMQITRTPERVKVSGLYLLNQYPEYCEINNKKKNKEFFEIKLRYKPQ